MSLYRSIKLTRNARNNVALHRVYQSPLPDSTISPRFPSNPRRSKFKNICQRNNREFKTRYATHPRG